MRLRRGLVLGVLLLVGCGGAVQAAAPTSPPVSLEPTFSPTIPVTPTAAATQTAVLPPGEPSPTGTASPTPLPLALGLDPKDWKHWQVQPIVTQFARLVYQMGQLMGNDPHAFSVLGDCQSEPPVFMGVYETDPAIINALPANLQEAAAWFQGSFNRKSPTVRGGTTTGALLWSAWHRNKYTCTIYESPLQCELRIHKPSFVIIHVGTHYETRNADYMRKILDTLLQAGVVPILATKADNRELDDRVNAEYAALAVEYNIPFWNFWAAVSDLPNRGLYTRDDARYQGDLYLTEAAVKIHRQSALEALEKVWREVSR